MEETTKENAAGIKSVSQAIRILNTVAQMDGPASLKQIAASAGVAPSKAHRYLQSLCSCGFLNQAAKSGSYDLGLEALRLGLAAVNRVDIVNRAGDGLAGLTAETNADSCLTVWGEGGPTIVRFERSVSPAVAMMGAGVSLPVLNSATGIVFLAFGNPDRVETVVRQQAGDSFKSAMEEVSQRIKDAQKAGYSYTVGVIMAGRQCIAAPIISYDDHIVAAVTLISTKRDIIKPDSAHVKKLLAFCKRHSVRKRGFAEETLIERSIGV